MGKKGNEGRLRITNRAFFLNDEEKARFVERLWRVAT